MDFCCPGDVSCGSGGLDACERIMTGRRPTRRAEVPLRFDVCLIPFLQNKVTHAVDPVKFYEFLSAGKPVVSVPLEELQIHREYLYFASDVDGFVQQIERALDETDPDLMLRRVALARDNDWKQRFARARTRPRLPRVSRRVISWNSRVDESVHRDFPQKPYRIAK